MAEEAKADALDRLKALVVEMANWIPFHDDGKPDKWAVEANLLVAAWEKERVNGKAYSPAAYVELQAEAASVEEEMRRIAAARPVVLDGRNFCESVGVPILALADRLRRARGAGPNE